MRVTCWRHLCKHKDFLRWSWYQLRWEDSLSLSLHGVTMVPDILQVKCHPFGCNLSLSRGHSWPIFVFEYIKSVMMMIKSQLLRDLKFNFWDPKSALTIVDCHICKSSLIWEKHILIEGYFEWGTALSTTAAGLQIDNLIRLGVLKELNWWFVDHEPLFVLYHFFIAGYQDGLSCVLHFAPRLVSGAIGAIKNDWGGNGAWESELKGDSVISRV